MFADQIPSEGDEERLQDEFVLNHSRLPSNLRDPIRPRTSRENVKAENEVRTATKNLDADFAIPAEIPVALG